jgi:hypothetical protein
MRFAPRAGLLIVSVAAASVIVFVVARACYYPFWAFAADRRELNRSWGGPSAIGAIAAHWLVAASTGLAAAFVVRWSWRVRQRMGVRR